MGGSKEDRDTLMDIEQDKVGTGDGGSSAEEGNNIAKWLRIDNDVVQQVGEDGLFKLRVRLGAALLICCYQFTSRFQWRLC